jgi:hypothetical protein
MCEGLPDEILGVAVNGLGVGKFLRRGAGRAAGLRGRLLDGRAPHHRSRVQDSLSSSAARGTLASRASVRVCQGTAPSGAVGIRDRLVELACDGERRARSTCSASGVSPTGGGRSRAGSPGRSSWRWRSRARKAAGTRCERCASSARRTCTTRRLTSKAERRQRARRRSSGRAARVCRGTVVGTSGWRRRSQRIEARARLR